MPDGTLHQVQTQDHASLLVRLQSGVVGTINLSWAGTDGTGFKLAAHGSKGRLELTSNQFPGPQDAVLRGSQSSSLAEQIPQELGVPKQYMQVAGINVRADSDVLAPIYPMARAMQSMADTIRTGSSSAAPDFAQATHVQRVIDAAERSAQARAWCSV
jgi:predicted dehydrogenase